MFSKLWSAEHGSSFSNKSRVSSEVPQGSHLGPVLFLFFVIDLPKVVKHSVCLLIFRAKSGLNDCLLLQYNTIFAAIPAYRVRPSYCFLSCGARKPTD